MFTSSVWSIGLIPCIIPMKILTKWQNFWCQIIFIYTTLKSVQINKKNILCGNRNTSLPLKSQHLKYF